MTYADSKNKIKEVYDKASKKLDLIEKEILRESAKSKEKSKQIKIAKLKDKIKNNGN